MDALPYNLILIQIVQWSFFTTCHLLTNRLRGPIPLVDFCQFCYSPLPVFSRPCPVISERGTDKVWIRYEGDQMETGINPVQESDLPGCQKLIEVVYTRLCGVERVGDE